MSIQPTDRYPEKEIRGQNKPCFSKFEFVSDERRLFCAMDLPILGLLLICTIELRNRFYLFLFDESYFPAALMKSPCIDMQLTVG
jgi:hypothetical protein